MILPSSRDQTALHLGILKVTSGSAAGCTVKFPNYAWVPMKTTVSRYMRYKKEISTYHGDNPHVLVCKLVAEESGKSDALDSMLEGGLCGIVPWVVPASGSGGSRD